jgi:signal transduction histidine kinase
VTVAKKLIVAFALHVAILAALLAHHVLTLRTAVSTGYELTQVSSRIYGLATEQHGRVTQLEENAAKYWVTRDTGYIDRFREIFLAYAAELEQLGMLPLSEHESAALADVRADWAALDNAAARLERVVQELPAGQAADSLAMLQQHLDLVRLGTQRMSDASHALMRTRLEASARSARTAERLSWIAAAAALLLSVLVSFVIVRSIADSLSRLKEGTHAVARSRFDYRLDTSRGDEFADVAQDFNTMTERLAELDRMKRDFVSKVSHDLKTPLASMQETIRALLDEVPGPLLERQRRLLMLNHQSGERLSSMLAKLLDLSRLEAGVLEPDLRWLEVSALAADAVERSEAVAAERGIRLDLHAPPQPLILHCDGDRIIQLIDNLLENALKFSPAGSAIDVALRLVTRPELAAPVERWPPDASASASGAVLITVSDGGSGIADAQKERIFERFYQGDAGRDARGRGVGLGLAICREIATVHGGSIWAGDADDGGAMFSVILPRALSVIDSTAVDSVEPANAASTSAASMRPASAVSVRVKRNEQLS